MANPHAVHVPLSSGFGQFGKEGMRLECVKFIPCVWLIKVNSKFKLIKYRVKMDEVSLVHIIYSNNNKLKREKLVYRKIIRCDRYVSFVSTDG